jgi:hypothetical protein
MRAFPICRKIISKVDQHIGSSLTIFMELVTSGSGAFMGRPQLQVKLMPPPAFGTGPLEQLSCNRLVRILKHSLFTNFLVRLSLGRQDGIDYLKYEIISTS